MVLLSAIGQRKGVQKPRRDTGTTPLPCYTLCRYVGEGVMPFRWCSCRHRSHLGSRLCRSNAQVVLKANEATACLTRVRCSRLEPDEAKVSSPVLRGREGSNPLLLPGPRRTLRMEDIKLRAVTYTDLSALRHEVAVVDGLRFQPPEFLVIRYF